MKKLGALVIIGFVACGGLVVWSFALQVMNGKSVTEAATTIAGWIGEQPRVIVDDVEEIAVGGTHMTGFNIKSPATVEFVVKSEDASELNVFITTEEAFMEWSASGKHPIPPIAETRADADLIVRKQLPAGHYAIAVIPSASSKEKAKVLISARTIVGEAAGVAE